MKEPFLRCTIQDARTDAPARLLCAGESLELTRPATFVKDTKETRVWASTIPGGASLFFKLYRHRGWLSTVAARLFRSRTQREYEVLERLQSAGVACCEPIFWGRGEDEDNGRFELIATRAIPGARQLKAFLADRKKDGIAPDLAGLFSVIRDMHRAGVYHGSLTPNNLVASEGPDRAPSFYVVDLPRGLTFPFDLRGTEMAWYDLIHFVHRTGAEAGEKACLGILATYGFNAEESARFRAFLKSYRPSKALRWRLQNGIARRTRRLGPRGDPHGFTRG